jgi:hypothetical protein
MHTSVANRLLYAVSCRVEGLPLRNNFTEHFNAKVPHLFIRLYILFGPNLENKDQTTQINLCSTKAIFIKRAYRVHTELLCTYAHFKSGLSNAYPRMTHFFTNEPSHLPYDIVGRVREW